MTDGFPNPTRDWCDESGAIALKAIIEAFWRAQGFLVTVTLQHAGFLHAMRGRRHDLRSDLVNGLPTRSLPAQERQAA